MGQAVQTEVQKRVQEPQQKVLPAQPRTGYVPRMDRRRIIKYLSMGSVLALTLVGMYYYALVQSYRSTDDAFIEGKVTDVAPKISGRVGQVLVDDNQEVRKGDLLVTLEPGDYEAALRQKQAALDSARAQAVAVQAGIQQQKAHISTLEVTEEADRATAAADRANAVNAAALFKRSQELFARQVVAPQDLDMARANAEATQATLDAPLKKVATDEAQMKEAGYQYKPIWPCCRACGRR